MLRALQERAGTKCLLFLLRATMYALTGLPMSRPWTVFVRSSMIAASLKHMASCVVPGSRSPERPSMA
jgi:hypothetical protein